MNIRHALLVLAALATFALGAFLTGCGVKPQQLNPQQIAAIACPQLNLVHTQLVALNAALEADPATAAAGKQAQAQLDAVHPIVAAVCNGAQAAPAVDLSSIQALISTGLPALGHLAGSLPLPPAQQTQVQAALVVAETAAGVVGVVEQQISAAQPASAASAGKP